MMWPRLEAEESGWGKEGRRGPAYIYVLKFGRDRQTDYICHYE